MKDVRPLVIDEPCARDAGDDDAATGCVGGGGCGAAHVTGSHCVEDSESTGNA